MFEMDTWNDPTGNGIVRTEQPRTAPQLDEADYVRFRDLILDRTGMAFERRRRRGLASGVLKAAKQAGCDSLRDYYDCLYEAATNSELWDGLIGATTVGETYFFRNTAHIGALRNHILPELIASRRHVRRLRIWSAGCASGEEPYTIAILLRELIPDAARWNIHILGTDINSRAIERANRATYGDSSFRRTDPNTRQRHFEQLDEEWRPAEGVRRQVNFAYLNLAEDVYPSLSTNTNAMDLILCRNVAIYLPEDVTRRIVNRFEHCLVPDGWLIVGASETNAAVFSRFDTVRFDGATVYRKPPEERLQPEAPADVSPLQKRPASATAPEPETADAPSDDPHVEGLSLMAEGRYEEAIERFLVSIAQDPGSASVRSCEIAEAFANEGRLEVARTWCRRAIGHDPLLAEAYYILSIVDQEEGLMNEAVTQLKKTLYLEPGSALAHFSLANVYRETNRGREAARHRLQAIRLASKLPPDHVLPGSEGITAGRLLAMAKAMP